MGVFEEEKKVDENGSCKWVRHSGPGWVIRLVYFWFFQAVELGGLPNFDAHPNQPLLPHREGFVRQGAGAIMVFLWTPFGARSWLEVKQVNAACDLWLL